MYRLNKIPSVADYVRGLASIEARIHVDQLRLLKSHYAEPNRTSTATQLASKLGLASHIVVNAHYGRLGHMFCDATGFEADVRVDGTSVWWAVWSQGWQERSGFMWEMLPNVAQALEVLGWVSDSAIPLTEQVSGGSKYIEGSLLRVVVNAYERNVQARAKCIAHYGCSCVLCGFDFGSNFGAIGAGFIHVHHLKPLHEIGESYEVDPITDLRPVCPNCHAIIHLGGGCRSIEEVRRLRGAIR